MEVFIGFENKPFFFSKPESLICCRDIRSFDDAFREIEQALNNGFYVAGFFSYEAGYCFEECLRGKPTYGFPLILLGVYRRPSFHRIPSPLSRSFTLGGFHLNISKQRYASHIDIIRGHILKGDVYQITYCVKFKFKFSGDTFVLYNALLRRQPVPYHSYIRTGDFHVISLSPERFMKKKSRFLITQPMKGTWLRGSNILSDFLAKRRFSNDKKNKAENLMITDLLRNDLGRIGSKIRVPRLYTIDRYKTLFQMTSTVVGEIPADIRIRDLFAALYPCGSVTGAPKIRAMEIIRDLENEERKIYTGAIGYITPRRDIYFNIPIRTLLIKGGNGEMGVGGGIVWDSTVQGEWDEGLLKAKFLTDFS